MNKNTINRIRAITLLPNVSYDEYFSIKEILDKAQATLRGKCKA